MPSTPVSYLNFHSSHPCFVLTPIIVILTPLSQGRTSKGSSVQPVRPFPFTAKAWPKKAKGSDAHGLAHVDRKKDSSEKSLHKKSLGRYVVFDGLLTSLRVIFGKKKKRKEKKRKEKKEEKKGQNKTRSGTKKRKKNVNRQSQPLQSTLCRSSSLFFLSLGATFRIASPSLGCLLFCLSLSLFLSLSMSLMTSIFHGLVASLQRISPPAPPSQCIASRLCSYLVMPTPPSVVRHCYSKRKRKVKRKGKAPKKP